MSTLAEDDPIRAIRNAMERLRRAADGTAFESHVREESAIVEAALETLDRVYVPVEDLDWVLGEDL